MATEERRALLFADGSLSVYGKDFPVSDIMMERARSDKNETDLRQMTKVVRIRYEFVEVIFDPVRDLPVVDELKRLRAENEELRQRLEDTPRRSIA